MEKNPGSTQPRKHELTRRNGRSSIHWYRYWSFSECSESPHINWYRFWGWI